MSSQHLFSVLMMFCYFPNQGKELGLEAGESVMGQEWGGVVPQRQVRRTCQVRGNLAPGREKRRCVGPPHRAACPGGSGGCVGGGVGFCGSLGRQNVSAPSKFPGEVTVVAERMWG